jgi:ureidoglycolate lyase
MRKKALKELSVESFRLYGCFANMINPTAYHLGEEPIRFFRDMLQLDLGLATKASFSICSISRRPLIVDKTEIHSSCGEGILPLDGDILIHVGPAGRNGVIPLDEIEIFRVPKGTMVVLRPGTFHHAPLALDQDRVSVMIVLPERTYANDCQVFEIPENDRIEIIK